MCKFFWQHTWEKWSDPFFQKIHSGGYLIFQRRCCSTCGKVQERKV